MLVDNLIGEVVGGRYKVERLIGRGGMGRIYEVSHQVLGRKFAMKTLSGHLVGDAGAAARFFREADSIAKLRHPNVVDVFGWEHLDDGSPCIVMEFLRGQDLGQRIRERGALDWPSILSIADQVLSALAVAHHANIIHRDLKPANIFIARDDTGRETAKLLDFGLSKVVEGGGEQTTDARIMGTPSYMAPEQAKGQKSDIGPRTDVWAMGAILHEMATGQVAYTGTSPLQVLYRICNGEPDSLVERRPDAPAAFVELVARTLSRDSDRRICDALELQDGLRAALGSIVSNFTPSHGITQAPEEEERHNTSSLTVHDADATLNTSESTAFLLSEIIDAARLWEEYPDAMAPAVERHEAVSHEAMTFHGGTICKATGDAIVVAFPNVKSAAAAAVAAQRMLGRLDFGEIRDLQVRMAIHTGRTYERGGNYFGPTLNRAARILPLARGGQIVLSAAAVEILRENLPPESMLQDLGIHTLRDLTRPEHLYLLHHPDLKQSLPPPVAPIAVRNNLPHALSSFVGRKQELASVRDLLRTNRLVTVTGLGGSGKTRLALQIAKEALNEFPDGVWLVELVSVRDEELVAQTIGQALELEREGMFTSRDSWLDRLATHLKERRALLVLDNCEHVVESCAELVDALLRRCPSLRIIAASREALAVEGEASFALAPLRAPEQATLEEAHRIESVQLFVERVRLQQPDFSLTETNVLSICRICHELEGIPLAIELAAAQANVLSVDRIAQRLEDRFALLRSRLRGGAQRQKSLRATLDWSYERLSEAEQLLLARLSSFRGSFALGAAESVCVGSGLAIVEILDLLGQLAQKSLIRLLGEAGEPRYLLLDTVREYAAEKLEALGGTRKIQSRHRDWCVLLAERAEPGLRGPNQTTFLDELEAEADNIRAALKWALDQDEGRDTLRICNALWWFWMIRGHLSEGRRHLEHALAADVHASPEFRARAYSAFGMLYIFADPGKAKTMFEESLRLARETNDTKALALASLGLGWEAAFHGDAANMTRWISESQQHYQVESDPWGMGIAGCFLGNALAASGDRDGALRISTEAISTLKKSGDRLGLSWAYINFGEAMRLCGDYEQAVGAYQMAISLSRELGDPFSTVISLTNLGLALTAFGEHLRAESALRESLAMSENLGLDAVVPAALLGLAGVEFGRNKFERTARLLGASLAIQEKIGGQFHPSEQVYYEELFMRLRTAIDRDYMMGEIRAGEAMAISEARTFAQLGPSLLV